MTAALKISPVIPDDDPLWQKFLSAPVDPHPLSEQELQLLEQARSGGLIDGVTISAEIARRAKHETETVPT